jgi:hypothetical protein
VAAWGPGALVEAPQKHPNRIPHRLNGSIYTDPTGASDSGSPAQRSGTPAVRLSLRNHLDRSPMPKNTADRPSKRTVTDPFCSEPFINLCAEL